ncbi:MAG: TM0996/MTH895 family glutaredoxin-like protein [Candidatus Omnitrophica bacterium]|nr:TM0996/MTH895 family glutaredoxin-like protein [Candidatus Omnitrophota bacterium]MBU1872076.1 TM0996/MTH895 family glutaredoxin-like protein [Candidatus Omnitrophota bacterium]
MEIQVYGKGCLKCHQLAANTEQAIKDSGLEAKVEQITEINKITEKGIMFTPALLIDGKIICQGKIPGVEEIKQALKER